MAGGDLQGSVKYINPTFRICWDCVFDSLAHMVKKTKNYTNITPKIDTVCMKNLNAHLFVSFKIFSYLNEMMKKQLAQK